MVPVRYQGPSGAEVGRNVCEHVGIGDRPEPMVRAIRRGRGRDWSRLDGPNDLRGGAAAVVHEVDRFQVGLGGAHESQPIGDRARHGVLVGQDHAIVIGAQLNRANQAPGSGSVGGRHLVDEQGRRWIDAHQPIGHPAIKQPGRLLIPVTVAAEIRQDHRHRIVAIAVKQCLAGGVVDNVIRRTKQLTEPVVADGVPKGTERGQR